MPTFDNQPPVFYLAIRQQSKDLNLAMLGQFNTLCSFIFNGTIACIVYGYNIFVYDSLVHLL